MDTSWFWERIRNLATVVGILAVLTGFVQWLVEGWSGTTAVQTLAVAGIAGMLGVAWLGVAGLRRSLSRRKELRSVRQELEDSADTIALAERSQLLGRVIRLQQADEQQRRDSLSAILFGAGLALGGLLDLRRSLEDDVIGPGVIILAILGGLAVIWVFLWFGLRVVRSFRAASTSRRPCPFCAERIRVQAIVCPHCTRDLPEDWSERGTVPDSIPNPTEEQGQP